MADLVPANGAFSFAGLVADFNSMRVKSMQAVENVTPYGTNVFAKNRGSGTPEIDATVTGFMLKGSSLSNANPLTTLSSTGAATTFTFDTSCTLTGGCVMSDFEITHARMRAAVAFTCNLKNADEMSLAWA